MSKKNVFSVMQEFVFSLYVLIKEIVYSELK